MADLSESEYEHSSFEVLQYTNTSVTTMWDMVSTNISNDISDFSSLKSKINLFMRDHPTIVDEIRNHFSDELVEHILKRSFRVKFTMNDSLRTNILYQRFFIEQDSNIRILFDYFFDDIRLLILTGKFEDFPWSLRQAIIYTPKPILLKLTLTWLNFKGAESLTTMLYNNLINPIDQQSSGILFSFDQKNIYLFLIIYIFLLFTINIPMIGTMINCLSGIFVVIFIFYYCFSHFNR